MRPSDWSPLDGDLRFQASGVLITNLPTMEAMRRHCQDSEKHRHEAARGCRRHRVHKDKGIFPPLFCQAYARAVRTAWLHDLRAENHEDLHMLPLHVVLAKLNISLDQLKALGCKSELPESVKDCLLYTSPSPRD